MSLAFPASGSSFDRWPRWPEQKGKSVTSITEYQGCRIHTSQLQSGVWVASIVAPGSIVHHVRDEFESFEQAIASAKAYIDHHGRELKRAG